MAATDNEIPAPIIIKKIKKGGHGHHGGAWKVAYADFVTAMMAFFLLMWLLNVTTKEQKNAISNYFDPTHPRVSSELSGSGGILGGLTMSPEGAQVSTVQDVARPTTPTTPRSGAAVGKQKEVLGTSDYEGDSFDIELQGDRPSDTDKASDEDGENNLREGINILDDVQNIQQAQIEQLKQFVEAAENENFDAVKQKIYEEISKTPELADLKENLMVDITPEGLRIQIVDSEGRSMFPIGKAAMYDFMQKLVTKVTQVIIPQPNQISVRGHTDGKPYPEGSIYNNWNLSSDRAIASQRVMLVSGLDTKRVENVIGRADREHLLPEDPLSPRNRRISIVLLREKLNTADDIKKAASEVIEKKKEVNANAIKEGLVEDQEDIPSLEQTIDGSTLFTIETDQNSPRQKIQADPVDRTDDINLGQSNSDRLIETDPEEDRGTIDLPSTSAPQNKEPQVLSFP